MRKKLTLDNIIQGFLTLICVAVLVMAAAVSKSSIAVAESDTTDTAYRVYMYDGNGDLITNKKIEAGSLVTVKIPLYQYTKTYDESTKSYYYKLTGRLKGIKPPASTSTKTYKLPDFSYFTINEIATDTDGRNKSTISYMFWMPYSTLYVQADYTDTGITDSGASVTVTNSGDTSGITEYLKVATTGSGYVEMSSILSYGSADSFDTSSYLVDTDLVAYSATDTTTYHTLSLLSDSSTLATKYAGQLVTYSGVLDEDTDIDYLEFIDSKARSVSYDPSTSTYTTVDRNTFTTTTYRYLSATGERKYLITFAMPAEDIRISNIVTKKANTIENEEMQKETEEAATTLAETVNSQGEYEVISNPSTNEGDTAYQQRFYIDANDLQANRDAILELQEQMSGISIFYVVKNDSEKYVVPQDVQDVFNIALGYEAGAALTYDNIKAYIPDTGYYIISGTQMTQTAAARHGYSTVKEYADSVMKSTQKLANLPEGATIVLVSNSSSAATYSIENFKKHCEDEGIKCSAYENGWYMIATYGTGDNSITKAIKVSDEVQLIN